LAVLVEFWRQQQAHFTGQPAAAAAAAPAEVASALRREDVAAWVATARVLLNLDEFITRE
jgi:hypothetical protein